MWLLKVGKREHLELFRDGVVHFNPISFFRGDGTSFRGDAMEGTYVIDTSKGFLVDGIDISKYGSGFRATQTYVDSDGTLIFCAALLDNSNSQPVAPNAINLFDAFAEEMKKFGQYAVVFELDGFVRNINAALHNRKCNTAWGKVVYCNKEDHASVRDFVSNSKNRLGETAIYFLKDEPYRHQNEWRYIIDYITPEETITLNEDGSLDLKIQPFSVSEVIDFSQMKKIED